MFKSLLGTPDFENHWGVVKQTGCKRHGCWGVESVHGIELLLVTFQAFALLSRRRTMNTASGRVDGVRALSAPDKVIAQVPIRRRRASAVDAVRETFQAIDWNKIFKVSFMLLFVAYPGEGNRRLLCVHTDDSELEGVLTSTVWLLPPMFPSCWQVWP